MLYEPPVLSWRQILSKRVDKLESLTNRLLDDRSGLADWQDAADMDTKKLTKKCELLYESHELLRKRVDGIQALQEQPRGDAKGDEEQRRREATDSFMANKYERLRSMVISTALLSIAVGALMTLQLFGFFG